MSDELKRLELELAIAHRNLATKQVECRTARAKLKQTQIEKGFITPDDAIKRVAKDLDDKAELMKSRVLRICITEIAKALRGEKCSIIDLDDEEFRRQMADYVIWVPNVGADGGVFHTFENLSDAERFYLANKGKPGMKFFREAKYRTLWIITTFGEFQSTNAENDCEIEFERLVEDPSPSWTELQIRDDLGNVIRRWVY